MRYNARSYGNHDLIQRYCRHIDDNVVVVRDGGDDGCGDEYFECLTKRCGGHTACRHNREMYTAEMRIPEDGAAE